jgi:hypothetical protein
VSGLLRRFGEVGLLAMVTGERRGELLALRSRDSYHGRHGDDRAKWGAPSGAARRARPRSTPPRGQRTPRRARAEASSCRWSRCRGTRRALRSGWRLGGEAARRFDRSHILFLRNVHNAPSSNEVVRVRVQALLTGISFLRGGAWGADVRGGGSQLGEVDRKEVVHDVQRLLWGELSVGVGG